MKIILHILLFPFSIIYGVVTFIRNKFYDWKLFKATSFNLPLIIVGNLNIGGVGKTPHVEYLIRLLEKTHKISTLSRGYKRKTTGFVLADNNANIETIGDEPLQYFKKFKNILVAVDEKRVNGIQQLLTLKPKVECIILDDAFQHRAIIAGLNILVTDYNNLYINDTVLPSGRLREWKTGMKRAQLIIVSKCNPNLTDKEMRSISHKINPFNYQEIYFSAIKYGKLTSISKKANNSKINDIDFDSALIITGIANPAPFIKEISSKFKKFDHIKFSDHHQFNENDIKTIKERYNNLKGNNKILITTEKDFMRLSLPEILQELNDIPFYYIPIEIYFLGNGKENFDTQINNYVTTNTRN